MYRVAALYKFVQIDDCEALQSSLRLECEKNGIIGTLLIAKEGVNGTVAGSHDGIESLLSTLKSDARFADIEVKLSHAQERPFYRLKVKVKSEIVTMGVDGVSPSNVVNSFQSWAWDSFLSDAGNI